jgi:hypothetical protein
MAGGAQWTEPDLEALVGQPESIRREFKSGRLVENDPESKWIVALSEEISAFANTEGGELFLGIDEDKKSKPRVARALDGVPESLGTERLQQLIEGNLSPYLPGIRVQRVRLTNIPNKVVFVIQVPQGNTAYQAKDGRYYGRSEFEKKFLPDHEVRLRMSRGKTAHALVVFRVLKVELGADKEASVRSRYKHQYEHLEKTDPNAIKLYMLDEGLELAEAKYAPDKVTFAFAFRNDGEVTIRDPVIELHDTHSQALFDEHRVQAQALLSRVILKDGLIYPGDEQPMEASERWMQCRREASFAPGDYVARWKIYLDNSPPSSGEIDLGLVIDAARKAAAPAKQE